MSNFEYKNLTPFKWFVLENFPFIEADFDAITNWQLFSKLGNELNKLINSTNTLGTQVEDLTNYFNNLDVQEEIDNKLNDMVESGELEEIIAQYLNSAGLLCFNTLNDMKQATNLINGSFVKTFGLNEYNDGKGEFYKVRNILNTDVIDEVTIIALNNFNTLIAEKIKNINVNVTPNITIGCFHKKFSETDKKSYIFISKDNYNFTKIPDIVLNNNDNNVFSDPFITWDNINKQFIISTDDQTYGRTCTIVTTKDLKTFNYFHITLNFPITIGNNKFSPTFLWDNNELYLIISVNESGYQVSNWHIMIAKCNDLINMTFDNATEINYTSDNNSDLYDISIIKYNNKYYMTGANQNTAHVELYESTTLNNFIQTDTNLFQTAGGNNVCEGGRFAIINNELYSLVEYHNDEIIVGLNISSITENSREQRVYPSLKYYKSGNIINLSDPYALDVIQKLNVSYNDNTNYNIDTSLNTINMISDTIIDNLTLVPNKIIAISGDYTLTIRNILDPFNLKEMNLIINSSNCTINIEAYKNNSDFNKSIIIHNNISHSKFRTINFNYYTNDNSYDEYLNKYGLITAATEMSSAFNSYYNICYEVNKVKTFKCTMESTATSCNYLKCINLDSSIKPIIDTEVGVFDGLGNCVGVAYISSENSAIYLTVPNMTIGNSYFVSGTYI